MSDAINIVERNEETQTEFDLFVIDCNADVLIVTTKMKHTLDECRANHSENCIHTFTLIPDYKYSGYIQLYKLFIEAKLAKDYKIGVYKWKTIKNRNTTQLKLRCDIGWMTDDSSDTEN